LTKDVAYRFMSNIDSRQPRADCIRNSYTLNSSKGFVTWLFLSGNRPVCQSEILAAERQPSWSIMSVKCRLTGGLGYYKTSDESPRLDAASGS